MCDLGPPSRTIWLMHEPPLSHPLATSIAQNRDWYLALQRFSPLLTLSGHDHNTPIQNNIWHVHTGQTTCVNVGQGTSDLHYCLIDFQFQSDQPSLPAAITLHAFPQNQSHQITLRLGT
ncbi:metallophosphoesterase family protein [Pedosphaera parvula]|uniref:Uncharacterized protein n=1 Tax=Pedosphaera parvula (strain Ellin514) TaxID=320771 RepID=B9XPI5_PEDPL|nr:metallophosphoesterase family protein [Pedosphaera parvula]EEF58213.1 hypothetical protein Cflav_PD1413 [Pedosphaera parvula Ellin514]